MRSILLPCAGVTKSHVTSWRQAIFADIPLLELPPIEDRSRQIAPSHRNVRRAFSMNDSQRQASSCLANLFGADQEATGSAGAKISFRVDDDGAISGLGNEREELCRQILSFRIKIGRAS